MIHFLCADCGRSLRVADNLAGKEVLCRYCDEPQDVPEPKERTPWAYWLIIILPLLVLLAIGVYILTTEVGGTGLLALVALCFLVVGGVVVYFLPVIVALMNGHRNATSVGVLNLFLGWTFLGWVLALVWACMRSEAKD